MTWGLQGLGVSLGPLPTALLALPVGIAVTALFLIGTDRVIYRFYRQQKAKPIIFLIASMGIMFVMNGVVRFIIGVDDQRFADGERFIISARTFRELTGLDEGLAFRTSQGITIVVAIIAVALLFWFLNKTRTGKSMRAFSDNEDLALLSGINPERVVMITWIIVAALATTAGVLYGLDKSVQTVHLFPAPAADLRIRHRGRPWLSGWRNSGRVCHRLFRGDGDLCVPKGRGLSCA